MSKQCEAVNMCVYELRVYVTNVCLRIFIYLLMHIVSDIVCLCDTSRHPSLVMILFINQ